MTSRVLQSPKVSEPRHQRADDAIFAVAAHSLINSLSVVLGSLETLAAEPPVSAEVRTRLIERSIAQTNLAIGILQDLARGLPTFARLRELGLEPPG